MPLACFVPRLAGSRVFSEHVSDDAIPEGRSRGICCKEGGRYECGGQAFPFSKRLPVNVGQTQPHREFIERQSKGYSEDDGNTQMPFGIARRQRGESGDHQQKDSPEQMMDMKSAFGDEIVNRQNLIMNDVRERPQEHETNNEGNQAAQRDLPSQTELPVMMLQATGQSSHL